MAGPAGRRARKGKWRRRVAFAVPAVAILLALVYTFRLGILGPIVEARVEDALSEVLGRRVEVDRIEALELDSVTVVGVRAAPDETVLELSIERVTVEFSAGDLIAGAPRALRSVRVERPSVVLSSSSAPEAQEEAEGPPPELRFDPEAILAAVPDIEIRRGRVTWRGRGRSVEVDGIEIHLGRDAAGALALSALAERLGILGPDGAHAWTGLRVEAEADGRAFRIGRVEWLQGALLAPVSIDLDRARDGALTARFELALGAESLRGRASTVLDGGVRRTEVELEQVDLRLERSRLLAFLESPPAIDLSVRGAGRAVFRQGGEPKLEAEGDLEVAGTIEERRIDRGRLRVATRGGRVELDECALEGEGIRGTGRGAIERDGRIAIELDGQVALARSLEGVQGVPALGGEVAIAGALGGTLEEPSFDGRAVWESPRIGDVAFEKAEATLSYRAGELVLPETKLVDQAGNELRFQGRARPLEFAGSLEGTLRVADLGALLAGLGVSAPGLAGAGTLRFSAGGTRDDPSGRVELEASGRHGEVEVRRFAAALVYEDRVLTVESLEVDSGEGSVRAALAGRRTETGFEVEVLSLAGEFRGMPFERAARAAPCSVRWAEGEGLSVSGFALAAEGATLEARGRVDLERESLDLDVSLSGADAGRLRARLGDLVPGDLSGRATARAIVRGPWSEPEVEGAVVAEDLAWRDLAGRLSARGSWRAGRLAIDDLSLSRGRGRLSARGSVVPGAGGAPPTLDLAVRIDSLDLGDAVRFVPSLAGAGGRLGSGDLLVRGPADRPSIDGEVRLDDGWFELAEGDLEPCRGVSARIAFEGRRARCEVGPVVWSGATLRGGVEVGWEEGPIEVGAASARFEGLPLEGLPWSAGLPVALAGTISGEAEVAGLGADVSADVAVRGERLSVDGFELGALHGRLVLARGRLSIEGVRLAGAWGEVAAAGRVDGLDLAGPLDPKRIDLAVDLEGKADLAAFPGRVPTVARAWGRLVAGPLAIRGTAARPEVVGPISIDGAGAVSDQDLPPIENVVGRLRFEGRRLVVERLDGRFLDRPFDVSGGSIDFAERASPEIRTSLRLKPAAIRDVAGWLRRRPEGAVGPAPEPLDVDGTIALAIDVAGRLSDPEVRLVALVEGAAAGPVRVGRLSAAVRLSGGRLHLDSVEGESNLFRIQGAGGSIPLDASAEPGRVWLGIWIGPLEELGPEFRAGFERFEGRGHLGVAVAGSLADPIVQGEFEFADGRLRAEGSEHDLAGVGARLRFAGGVLHVDDARARVSGGPVSITGTVALAGEGAGMLDLAVRGDHVLGIRYDDFILRVSPDLTIRGPIERPRIEGVVDVVRAEYLRDFVITDPKVSIRSQSEDELERQPEPAPAEAAGSGFPMKGAEFDIRFTSAEGVHLKNKVCEGYANADLHLTGSTEAPILLGMISLTRGTIFFQGNTIQIELGEFRFTREELLVPRIRMVGRTRVDRYDLTIEVRGDRHELKIYPQSNPTLTGEQILSLLVSGKLPPETGARGQQAVAALAGALEQEGFRWEWEFLGRNVHVTLDQIRLDLGEGFFLETYADPTAGAVLGISYRVGIK